MPFVELVKFYAMNKLNIDEVHQILLGIGKEFHRICTINNIPYYMIGGTQLGAIRHGGFIPWDDDMDFGIPRPYYEKFKKCCLEQAQHPYKLITGENSSYPIGYYKMQDKGTLIEDPMMGFNNSSPIGVYIDIFPLDECSNDYSKLHSLDRKRIIFDHIVRGIFEKIPHRKWYYGIANYILHYLLPHNHTAKMWWMKQKNAICMKYSQTGKEAMINLYGIYKERELVDKSIWGKPTLYKFEDTEFLGPEDYDGFLKQIYKDYMKLPPENKRHIHVDNVFRK